MNNSRPPRDQAKWVRRLWEDAVRAWVLGAAGAAGPGAVGLLVWWLTNQH